MKRKTEIIFLAMMLSVVMAFTGCGNKNSDADAEADKDMGRSAEVTEEDEKIGDSSNMNQGVIEPGTEGVEGDATDAGDADNNNVLDDDAKDDELDDMINDADRNIDQAKDDMLNEDVPQGEADSDKTNE